MCVSDDIGVACTHIRHIHLTGMARIAKPARCLGHMSLYALHSSMRSGRHLQSLQACACDVADLC